MLLTYELPQLQQTATILDLKLDVDKTTTEDESVKATDGSVTDAAAATDADDQSTKKSHFAKAIVDFLISPTGKTIADVQKEQPEDEDFEDEKGEDEDGEEEAEDEEEEEEVKPKGSPRKRGAQQGSGGRPKRATATRVWTKGEFLRVDLGLILRLVL